MNIDIHERCLFHWFICFPHPLYPAGLRKICKAIVEAQNDEERVKAFGPLQEIITFVQFANDECDYGMGYELGMDLFCYGSHVSRINRCIEALVLSHSRDLTLLQPTVSLAFSVYHSVVVLMGYSIVKTLFTEELLISYFVGCQSDRKDRNHISATQTVFVFILGIYKPGGFGITALDCATVWMLHSHQHVSFQKCYY